MRAAHYDRPVKPRILILGAGFGGLELATTLSEVLGDDVEVTLIDKSDAFVFGYSKLDVMFGRTTPDAVRLPYRHLAKPGVRLLRETVTAIDPVARAVKTDVGVHEADHLVVALGADYDMDATPGLRDSTEFYSVEGAERLAQLLPEFSGGRAVVGVCGAPYKCPPAPSEAALLLHDLLDRRGVRGDCEISLVVPFPTPIPPSPSTSDALLRAFAERGIGFVPDSPVASLDVARNVAVLANGAEVPYDLFLGVPKHRAPDVVIESGMAVDGYIPVDGRDARDAVSGRVCARRCRDGRDAQGGRLLGAPGAGRRPHADRARARGPSPPSATTAAARATSSSGAAWSRGSTSTSSRKRSPPGRSRIRPTEFVAEKVDFGSTRRARWFGL